MCLRRKVKHKKWRLYQTWYPVAHLFFFFLQKIATVGIKPMMCWSFQIKTWHSNDGVGAEINVKNRIEPWLHYRRTNRITDFFFWGGGERIVTHFLIFLSLCFVRWNCELHILGGGGTLRLNLNICTCWHSDLTTLWQTSWGDKGQERQERGGK